MPEERAYYLPRLAPEFYQGDAVVHWTMSIVWRATGWLTDEFHLRFRELLLHAAAREGLFCPVYCLMPDHIHLVWMGLRPDSDQRNGMAFLRTYLKPLLAPARLQKQPQDTVLREEQRRRNAFAKVCWYVLMNPHKAELVKDPREWRFSGAVIPGYPNLDVFTEDHWPKFWKLYEAAVDPAAKLRLLPLDRIKGKPKDGLEKE